MTDLGNLTILLKDKHKSLSNLEWADVNEEEYREYEETLPKQNLDAIPDLEEHWKHLNENETERLHPTNREPSKPNSPFWSERDIPSQLNDENKIKIVEDFLKKHLMAGATAKEATTRLKNHFDKRALALSKPRIKDALSERGLLGTVYVDSSLFPNCDQGEGQDFVDKHNKESKFVIAKNSCSGCVWNKNGVCSRFQKDLVFDVEYTEDLWSFYENKAEALGKDLSEIKKHHSPKEKIRKASLAPMKGKVAKLDGKPMVRNLAASVTKEDALHDLKSADIQREVVGNVYRDNKIKRVAREMLSGNHGPQVRDLIATDSDLYPLKKHLYLMGRLYADLSYFEDRESAQQFLAENESLLTYGTPQDGENKKVSNGFSLKSPDSINQLLHRYALSKYGHNYLEKKGSVLEKLATRLSSLDEDRLRSFAQSVYQEPLPQDTKDYEHLAPMIFDPTKGISASEAKDTFDDYEAPSREILESGYRSDMERELAFSMLKGDHSDSMRARLSSEGFDDLKSHLHLMGRLYVVSSYVSKKDYDKVAKRNPDLKKVPYISEDDLNTFFNKESVRNLILARYKKVKGLTSDKNADSDAVSNLKTRLSSMKAEDLRSFAQLVYSRHIPKGTKDYEHHGHLFDPTAGISLKEAENKLDGFEVLRKTAHETSSAGKARKEVSLRMLEGDHGPAVQALIEVDSVLRPLKSHLHLLGRLYTASFLFDKKSERKAFYNRNSHLQNLPDLKETDTFYSDKNIHVAILKRAALVNGIHPVDKKKETESFIKNRLASFVDKSPDSVHKIAQKVFSKPLPSVTRDYRGAVFSTKQVKISEMEVKPEDLESFKTKMKNKERGKATKDLKFYLKRTGGKKLLENLNDRLGMETIKALYLDNSKTSSSSMLDHSRKKEAAKRVLTAVIDPNFEPSSSESVIMSSFFDTKIGRWVRDKMVDGVHGERLSRELSQTFEAETLIKNAPIILAMREEEGLFGTSYSKADSYEDCAVGKRALKSSVTQIVKGKKCTGCVYNKRNGCLLYGKGLVEKPSYNKETLKKALSARVSKGNLTQRDVKAILDMNTSYVKKVRRANTVAPNTEARKGTQAVRGFYADSVSDAKAEKKIGSMLKQARKMLVDGHSEKEVRSSLKNNYDSKVIKLGSVYLDKIIERTQSHMNDFVNQESLDARTGLDQMEDLELTSSQINSVTENINFNNEAEDNQQLEGFSFGGFTKE